MSTEMRRVTAPMLLTLAALLALATTSDWLRSRAHGEYMGAQTYEDIYYVPPAQHLRVLSLGWDEALADLLWMRALVYFGDEFRHEGAVAHVFDYAEAIETLDPEFNALYHWVGTAGMYRPQAVTPEDVERTIAFMRRGAARFPEDGELAWSIGAAYLYELVPLLDDEADKQRAQELGMPYLMAASRMGAAPEWAALTNASLLDRLGRTEQAARHLEDMYLSVRDPAMRARLENAIQALRQRAEADAFMGAMRHFEFERQEDFPYLEPGLYLLVGPRPPVDVDAAIREGFPSAFADVGEASPNP